MPDVFLLTHCTIDDPHEADVTTLLEMGDVFATLEAAQQRVEADRDTDDAPLVWVHSSPNEWGATADEETCFWSIRRYTI